MTSTFFPGPSDLGHHMIFGNVAITTLTGDHLQISLAEIPKEGVVDWHSHSNEQMGMMISGQAEFFIADERRILNPGEMYRIPGDVRHKVVAINGPATALDIFYPIRPEYR